MLVKQISDARIRVCFCGSLGFTPCDSGQMPSKQARHWFHELTVFSQVSVGPLQCFRHGHLVPFQDEVCFGAAISACEAGAEWQHALNLLQQLLQAELLPNTVILNALASACEAWFEVTRCYPRSLKVDHKLEASTSKFGQVLSKIHV